MDSEIEGHLSTPLNSSSKESDATKVDDKAKNKKSKVLKLRQVLHQINALNEPNGLKSIKKRSFMDMQSEEDPTSTKKVKPKEIVAPPIGKENSIKSRPIRGNVSTVKAFARCKKLIDKMMRHEFSEPFLEPVDPVALKIPDYFDLIKTPMDLGTIRSRLEHNYYADVHEFAKDTRLVWQNAMSYNHPKSDIYKMAQCLSIVFEEHFPKILVISEQTPAQRKRELELKFVELQDSMKSFGKHLQDIRTHGLLLSLRQPKEGLRKSETRSSKPMTFEEKSRLSQAINSLAPQYLSGVFSIIDEEIPNAFKTDSSEVELDIDSLAPVVLRRLESYIRTAGEL